VLAGVLYLLLGTVLVCIPFFMTHAPKSKRRRLVEYVLILASMVSVELIAAMFF
jgi:hypothetical protein